MKFKNRFIDLTKSNDIYKLAELHRQQSFGGTKRYQCSAFHFLEDEFHPLWNTFIKGDKSLEVKVNIQSFNKELKQRESSDYIWFDLKIKEDSVEAVCQLNKKIRFLVANDVCVNMIKATEDSNVSN
jgi:hypothetical protein